MQHPFHITPTQLAPHSMCLPARNVNRLNSPITCDNPACLNPGSFQPEQLSTHTHHAYPPDQHALLISPHTCTPAVLEPGACEGAAGPEAAAQHEAGGVHRRGPCACHCCVGHHGHSVQRRQTRWVEGAVPACQRLGTCGCEPVAVCVTGHVWVLGGLMQMQLVGVESRGCTDVTPPMALLDLVTHLNLPDSHWWPHTG